MSIIKSEDSRKWITALVVITAAIVGYCLFKLVGQLGAWFDLEAKISNFGFVAQIVGFLAGASTFVYLLKSKKSSTYLQEVYNELVKVVWPSKDATVKMTVGIAIALVIVAGIFTVVDFIFQKLLEYIY